MCIYIYTLILVNGSVRIKFCQLHPASVEKQFVPTHKSRESKRTRPYASDLSFIAFDIQLPGESVIAWTHSDISDPCVGGFCLNQKFRLHVKGRKLYQTGGKNSHVGGVNNPAM
jgi:hypothetical protein